MKKQINILITVALLMLSATAIKAVPPNWSVNPSLYAYSMTITGAINTNAAESVDKNDIVAAFVGTECRGLIHLSLEASVNRYLAYLIVYSNQTQETVTFKIYDASADKIFDVAKTMQYQVNGINGQIDQPYIFASPGLPTNIMPDILNINEGIPANSLTFVLSTEDPDDTEHIYSLVSGAGDTDNAKFTLTNDSLFINSIPNYETQTQYSILVQTDDMNGGTYTENLLINVTDINDELPVIENATLTFDETIPLETVIIPVTATDADASPEFRKLHYSIKSGNSPYIFDIDTATGVITLANPSDFETKFEYTLLVSVSDGLHSATATITITFSDINDEIPVMKDTTLSVAEFAEIGDVLGTLIATDADANSNLSFSFSAESDNGVFSISPEGEVALVKYVDFEMVEVYTLIVEVYDGVNTGKGILTIKVIDFVESAFDAYNTFSPNGDGVNDFWEIKDKSAYRNSTFYIYSNTGQLLYKSLGYNNDWDGTFNGEDLPIGVYYYNVQSAECPKCKFTGTISLIR